jgi:hypothetical protein
LAEKFGAAAISRFFGDIPEEDKAAILDGLVAALEELTTINRYFAEQLFNKFGDEETGEFKKKPDIRDFLTAWSEATLRLMTEEELDQDGPDDGEPDDGEPDDDLPPEDEEGVPPVIPAEYRVFK